MADAAQIVAIYGRDANLDAALEVLREQGHSVRRSDNLYRAIALAAPEPFDVVVVDVDDLEPKEFSFFEVLREQAPSAYVLLTFSLSHRDKALRAIEKGANAYVLKPFYIDELCSIILNRPVPVRAGEPAADAAEPDVRDERELHAPLANFAKGVAHEINNPLTTVSGWLQMLIAEAPDDDPRRQTFVLMEEEARRIARVVSSLQTFAEQRPVRRTAVPAAKLLNDVLDDFAATHRAGGIAFERKIADSLPAISVDIEQIRDAFKSILDNVASPSHANGAIEVVASMQGAQGLQIRFHNPGLVVGDAHVDRIFDPFCISQGRSLGLGLAIASGIVRNHGGQVTVQSDQAVGTEFGVCLPVNGQ